MNKIVRTCPRCGPATFLMEGDRWLYCACGYREPTPVSIIKDQRGDPRLPGF